MISEVQDQMVVGKEAGIHFPTFTVRPFDPDFAWLMKGVLRHSLRGDGESHLQTFQLSNLCTS